MGNVIIILIIVIILSLSIGKVVSDKRKGVKCIGCPHGKSCSNKNSKGNILELAPKKDK